MYNKIIMRLNGVELRSENEYYKKDKKIIEKALKNKEDLKERTRVANYMLTSNITNIILVLKDFAGHPIAELLIETAFDEKKIEKALYEEDLALFFSKANLLFRTVNLKVTSNPELKLRIYFAILNYIKYKESLAC